MPIINNPKEYGDRWNGWWWGMQPSWREPDSPFEMPSEALPSSWSHLLCGGPNGFLLVILALAWWMASNAGNDSSLIEEAATDVTWVLGKLVLALGDDNKGKKRQLDDGHGDDLPSSKRYFVFHNNISKAKANEI
jgi:hypothetical protein